MKRLLIFFVLFFPLTQQLNAQDEKATSLLVFSNMIGGTWKAEGKWLDGKEFKQHVVFEWGLNQQIIKVKTYGYTDEDNATFGLRSEGIRAWSDRESGMKFWEFDVFGELTEGLCLVDGENFHYLYEYKWDDSYALFKDSWTKIDDDTYRYRVGVFAEGKWTAIYLDTTFKRSEK